MLYADDAVLFYAGTRQDKLKNMKDDITKITKCTTENKLLLSESKCTYMNFGNRPSHNKETVEISNIKLFSFLCF